MDNIYFHDYTTPETKEVLMIVSFVLFKMLGGVKYYSSGNKNYHVSPSIYTKDDEVFLYDKVEFEKNLRGLVLKEEE